MESWKRLRLIGAGVAGWVLGLACLCVQVSEAAPVRRPGGGSPPPPVAPEVWFTKSPGHGQVDESLVASQTQSCVVINRSVTAYPLTVYYSLGGTATPGVDYLLTSSWLPMPGAGLQSVTLPAGVATASVWISAVADTVQESTESVLLTIVPHPTTPSAYIVNSYHPAEDVLIHDVPFAGEVDVLSVDALDPVAIETDALYVARFRIRRTPGSQGLPDRNYSYFVGGTATPDVDYTGPVSVPFHPQWYYVHFTQGQTEAYVEIVASNDGFPEGIETVMLKLLPADGTGGYVVGVAGQATASIADNPSLAAMSMADLDHDGDVDVDDIAIMLGYFAVRDPRGDVNLDGQVNIDDVLFVMSSFSS